MAVVRALPIPRLQTWRVSVPSTLSFSAVSRITRVIFPSPQALSLFLFAAYSLDIIRERGLLSRAGLQTPLSLVSFVPSVFLTFVFSSLSIYSSGPPVQLMPHASTDIGMQLSFRFYANEFESLLSDHENIKYFFRFLFKFRSFSLQFP